MKLENWMCNHELLAKDIKGVGKGETACSLG